MESRTAGGIRRTECSRTKERYWTNLTNYADTLVSFIWDVADPEVGIGRLTV